MSVSITLVTNLAYQYHNGTVGSILGVTDETGAVTQRFNYDEFGTRTTQIGTSRQYGYTGEEFDNETGLLYLRARYYDPSLGRFISNDPYWGRLEEPVTQNRYIYVKNNPLMYSDPSGFDESWGIRGSVAYGLGDIEMKLDIENGVLAFSQTTFLSGTQFGANAGYYYSTSIPQEGINPKVTGSLPLGPVSLSGEKEITFKNLNDVLSGKSSIRDILFNTNKLQFNLGAGEQLGAAVGLQSTSILFSPGPIDESKTFSGKINAYILNCVNGH